MTLRPLSRTCCAKTAPKKSAKSSATRVAREKEKTKAAKQATKKVKEAAKEQVFVVEAADLLCGFYEDAHEVGLGMNALDRFVDVSSELAGHLYVGTVPDMGQMTANEDVELVFEERIEDM